MPINRVNISTDEVFTRRQQITQRMSRDIPSLGLIWNPLVEASMGISPWDDHPITKLLRYVSSLTNVCEQILYAQERLQIFSTIEASNIFEFYVAHYLYDIMARVKTTTDLLALIINHVFKLGLKDKVCSLENGAFSGKIGSSIPGDQHRERLATKIDKVRNSWLETFDKLRDLVVHQAGIQLMGAGGMEHAIHIGIPLPKSIPRNAPFAYDPQKPLEALKPFTEEVWVKFLVQIESVSVSEYLITVDPVKLSEEIWRRLSTTADELINECEPEIRALIATHRPSKDSS